MHIHFLQPLRRHQRFLLIFLWITAGFPCVSQIANQNFEQFSESAEEQKPLENDDAWMNDLSFFRDHPINLNDTRKEELEALHLLTEIQISNLFQHLQQNGKLLIIYELQTIEGFDLPTIQKLLPYICVKDPGAHSQLGSKQLLKGDHTLLIRYAQVLEKQSGYRKTDNLSLSKSSNSRYLGNPQKWYVGYRYTSTAARFGITAEKDPGELFFRNKTGQVIPKHDPGFDFYSAYLFIQQIKNIKAIAIGDYSLRFGQGLTLWNGTSVNTTSAVFSIRKNASGISPFTSTDENRFMRGIAGSIQIGKFTCSPFYSLKKVDAHVSDTLENGKPASITTLQQSGLHTTLSEIKDKHTVKQLIYGTHIAYLSKRLSLGFTVLNQQLDVPFRQNTNALKASSKKQRSVYLGGDYSFILHNAHFFGEVCGLANGGVALLNGVLIALDARLSFTALHRYYQEGYENILSSGFSQSSTSNEKGLNLGISINLSAAIQLNAGIDRFEFPHPVTSADGPSQGSELNFLLNYVPSKRLTLTFRIHQSGQEKNSSQQQSMKALVPYTMRSYRLHLDYRLTRTLQLRNRVELLDQGMESIHQSGYLIYQDVLYHNPDKPFGMTIRYALFDTDGYDSRLYAYENDLPGTYSVPAYYDRGSRFYVLINYSLTKHLECWLRYSRTSYDDKDVIAEGSLAEIFGNTKSELKAQIRFTF
jgi:hypothetical protein